MLAALGLPSCSEPRPEGYRSGAEAIREAEQFEALADRCHSSSGREAKPEPACTQAMALYEKFRTTPTHFASSSEADRFFEAHGRGTNLMFMAFQRDICLAETKAAVGERLKTMCDAAGQANAEAWERVRN